MKGFPEWVLGLGGAVVPTLRELRETEYSGAITRELGLEPTPWEEVCRATALGRSTGVPSNLSACGLD